MSYDDVLTEIYGNQKVQLKVAATLGQAEDLGVLPSTLKYKHPNYYHPIE
jgi:hypothetical protein